jgi:WD40 repeat protein
VKTLQGHENIVWCVILLTNETLVSGSWDKSIRLWNLTTSRYTKMPYDHQLDIINCLLLLDNHKQVASGESDYFIKIWNIQTLELASYWQAHSDLVVALVDLAKKGHMASSSQDMSIKIWNYENKNGAALLATLKGHTDTVMSLVLMSDGFLSSASLDRTVKTWNLPVIYNYPNRSNLIASDDD